MSVELLRRMAEIKEDEEDARPPRISRDSSNKEKNSGRCVYINEGDRYPDLYCNNRVSNTKYNLWNFLPKNLWEQFGRFMNKYFLLIAILQLWPLITPVNPASTWGPLLLIFSVSACKEAWDDYNRYKLDKQANERMVWVVKKGVKTRIQAQDIHVGDIVWLREKDEVPCDMILLGSSDPQGVCYIETSTIDGETDLKTRVVPSPCIGLNSELLHKIKGIIECGYPDRDIRRFDANLRLFPPFIDTDYFPITVNNTLLQSCFIRNTEWACGVAVYTGNETKLGMSRGLPSPKLTAVDAMIDKLTGAIFVFQVVVVIILGFAGNAWKSTEADKLWYVHYPKAAPWYEFIVIPLRFELLCSIMIPISIKVSLDLAKSMYAKFIDWDLHMYDEKTDTPAVATNTAISEDLGQIEYILTDKTGTLTENLMVFKKCCIKGSCYGDSTRDAVKDPALLRALNENDPEVLKFLTVMAVCNTVVPSRSPNGSISYKAQSQDEEALVSAASHLRVVLLNKAANCVEVSVLGAVLEFDILDVLEFTSDRKKMSVIVRERQTGELKLLTKGADEAIFSSVHNDQQVRRVAEIVDQYSQMGLRTLCLAWRDIREEEYHDWSRKFKEASSSIVDREWKIAEVCVLMERNLELLGATAIEDKLQDGVAETIESLRDAGINFWMLTGDKQLTAAQIALSCNFVLPEPQGQLLYVQGATQSDVGASLERVLRTMQISSTEHKDVAFVIDGLALEFALKYYRQLFAELASLCRTAICCRVTPSQKAQLVHLVKSWEFRTLAIGDGGNDVRMIQEAHVGVGISGREGLQAARAADYSLAKFRFLKRLILVHGRYSYNRSAFLSQYSIYKSLVLCFIQIFFSFVSGISGTSLFNSFSLMAYNVLYTSVPVMASVLDKDIDEKTVLQHPQILKYCQAGRLLNPSTFAGWFGRALFHGAVVFLITMHVYVNEKSEMEEVSLVALSGCIWLQAFVVALETSSFTTIQHIAIGGNLVAFYIFNLVASTVKWGGMYTIMFRICSQRAYWLTMLLIVGAGIGPIAALKFFRFFYRPSLINILQYRERRARVTEANATSSSNAASATSSGSTSSSQRAAQDEESSSVYQPLLLSTKDRTKRQ
ncbi:phospholipid-transporting ATPase 2 isoform X2 [Selaginella moellendorffii]|uniref:phospholipid-transporting ATPase 2 isoform X2 n=1 Tax=Selaginella moellendorffii TaxID=88036 RepID=UPI000D1CA72E|nr:phospholipid-transporting ATPase 2 isoform X2 [Selaginella moellendorffii]|eukprot:XP_024530611.1 phospholipid-transporting ATPase 2 isoform X2 [Selaginella moellendorffii]